MNLFSAVVAPFYWALPENDRRRNQRFDRVTMLVIQLLDNDLSAFGANTWAMSRDISDGGIGFVCADPIETEFIRVTIVEDRFSSLAIVRHHRELTYLADQYFVGVEFMDDSNDYLTNH